MRRISITTVALVVLLGGGPAWSQSSLAIMELERVVAESKRMLDEHRAAPQQNIELATAALQAKDIAKALRITPTHPEARAGMAIAMARTNDPKAQEHLAWFNTKIAECNGCWQAAQLGKFKADLESAMAAARRPAGGP